MSNKKYYENVIEFVELYDIIQKVISIVFQGYAFYIQKKRKGVNLMSRIKKSFLPLIIVVIVMSMFLMGMVSEADAKNKILEEQQAQIETLVEETEYYEERILAFEEEYMELKELEKEVQKIEEHIKLDEVSKLNQAYEISLGTPLDFETSCIVVKYADKFDLNPSLILSVIELESDFQYDLVCGAQDRGYMQIIPGTEKWLVETFGEELGFEYDPSRIFEADYNIGLGTAYLSTLQKVYGDDYNRILSEYNRGPYNLEKYYAKHNTYETTYSRVILNKEEKYLVYND